jgi:4-amino-4-deoxy-L-arabinose transferase-like glycosyltransferase
MTEAIAPASPAPNLLDRLAKQPILVLFILCLVAWVPGFFTLPPLDRDESRFAQASKQMIESGNYVDIRYSVGPRYKKPVGIYWLQAATTLSLSKPPYNEIWTYRLPSLLGGFLAVFLAYWCARSFASPPIALIAAALIGFTVSLTAETKIAKTDAVLLAMVLGSQALLMRAYLFARDQLPLKPSLATALAGWAAFAFGILLKGPIIVAVIGVSVLAISLWDRDWTWLRTLRWGPGVALMLAIVLPWGIAIAFASHGEFYEKSLGHDFAAKILGGQESHGAPPGYYLALASVTLWPATLFALPGVGSGIARRREPAVRYLLAWAAAAWLMFEIVPTKLPHYILPAYPAVAFLGALWAVRARDEIEPWWQTVLRIVAAIQFVLGVAAFTVATIYLPQRFGDGTPWWLMAGAGLAAAFGLAAVVLILGRRTLVAALCAVFAAVIFYPLIIWGVSPRLTQIWMSPQLAEKVWHDRAPGDPPVVLAGYVEPSLIFLLGTNTHIEHGSSAAAIAVQQGGLALIEDEQRKSFLARLAELHGKAVAIDQLSGFNYSRGRPEHVTFYRVTPAPQITAPPAE